MGALGGLRFFEERLEPPPHQGRPKSAVRRSLIACSVLPSRNKNHSYNGRTSRASHLRKASLLYNGISPVDTPSTQNTTALNPDRQFRTKLSTPNMRVHIPHPSLRPAATESRSVESCSEVATTMPERCSAWPRIPTHAPLSHSRIRSRPMKMSIPPKSTMSASRIKLTPFEHAQRSASRHSGKWASDDLF